LNEVVTEQLRERLQPEDGFRTRQTRTARSGQGSGGPQGPPL